MKIIFHLVSSWFEQKWEIFLSLIFLCPFLAQVTFKVIQMSCTSQCLLFVWWFSAPQGGYTKRPQTWGGWSKVGRKCHTQSHSHAPLGLSLSHTVPSPWQGPGCSKPASVLFPLLAPPPRSFPCPAQHLPSQACLRALPPSLGDWGPTKGLWPEPEVQGWNH